MNKEGVDSSVSKDHGRGYVDTGAPGVPVQADGNGLAFRKFLECTIRHNYNSLDHFSSGKTLADIMSESDQTGCVSTAFLKPLEIDGTLLKTPRNNSRRSITISADVSTEEVSHLSEGYSSISGSEDQSDAEDSKPRKGLMGTMRRASLRVKRRISTSKLFSSQSDQDSDNASVEDSSWQSASDTEGSVPKVEKKRPGSLTFSRLSTMRLGRGHSGKFTPMSTDLRYFEELLNKTKLDELILIEMFTCLSAGPENYEVKLGDEALGKSNRYYLERTGRCPDFIKPVSGDQLLSLNILFLTDGMKAPVDSMARNNIIDLLGHDAFKKYFSVLEKYKVSLPSGFAEAVESKRLAIRNALVRNKEITKLELLEIVEPLWHAHYVTAFEHPDLMSRYHSLRVDSPMLSNVISPATQSENYKKAFDEQKEINKIRKSLIDGDFKPFMALRSDRSREVVINGIKPKERKSNANLRALIATYLKTVNSLHEKLDLSYFGFSEDEMSSFLRMHSGRLTELQLGNNDSTDNQFIIKLSSLSGLKRLGLTLTPISAINSSLSITDLDLSYTAVNNSIFGQLTSRCQNLKFLNLSHTDVTQIQSTIKVVSLDIRGCEVDESILPALMEHATALKSLKISSSRLTKININYFNFLAELDISDCKNLLAIVSEPLKNIRRSIVKIDKLINIAVLRELTVYNSPVLKKIDVEDTAGLCALYISQNPELIELHLASGRVMPALSIMALNDNPKLKILNVNPAKNLVFSVRNSCNIKTQLNDVLCRSLLSQALVRRIENMDATALSVLLRVKENAYDWAVKEYGEAVFTLVAAPRLNATNANLCKADFSYADLTEADFSSADLSGAIFHRTNLTGARFGCLPFLFGHKKNVTSLAETSDGKLFVSADTSGLVILRDQTEVLLELDLDKPVSAMAFSPDKTRLAIAVDSIHQNPLTKAGFKDFNTFIAAIDPSKRGSRAEIQKYYLEIYDLTKLNEKQFNLISTTFLHSAEITRLVYSNDGKYIISSSEDGDIKILRVGKEKDTLHKNLLKDRKCPVCSIAAHPKNPQLVTAHEDGSLILWNYFTGANLEVLDSPVKEAKPAVRALVWSPNAKFLVSGGDDRVVRIWTQPLAKWKCEKLLIGHNAGVQCVAIDPQGKYIFSGDARGQKGEHSLIVWDATSGEMLRRISIEMGVYALSVDHLPLYEDGITSLIVRVASAGSLISRYIFRCDNMTYSLERADMSTKLNLTNVRMTKVIGLSEEQKLVLQMLGVEFDVHAEPPSSARSHPLSARSQSSRRVNSSTFFELPSQDVLPVEDKQDSEMSGPNNSNNY